MITLTLKNGIRVANFSSPHDFKFDDGTVLPAVSNEESDRLKINFDEDISYNQIGDIVCTDIKLSFTLTEAVKIKIDDWLIAWNEDRVDIVLVPLPMLTAMKNQEYDIVDSPFRCIRVEDRTDRVVSSKRFCV